MATWNEVYAPLGASREPTAPRRATPAGRGAPWRLVVLAGVAAMLVPVAALAPGRILPRTETLAPAPNRPSANLAPPRPAPFVPPARPVTPTPAPWIDAASATDSEAEARRPDGPLIIDVAEALAKLKRVPPAMR